MNDYNEVAVNLLHQRSRDMQSLCVFELRKWEVTAEVIPAKQQIREC